MLFRKAFCPVCFRTMGNKPETAPGRPSARVGYINQWAQPDQYAGQVKPFGVIQSSTGRGSIKTEGYFTPQDDVDGFFPLVKGRLLAALQDYIRQGWLTPKELLSAISGIKAPADDGGLHAERTAPAKKKKTGKTKGP